MTTTVTPRHNHGTRRRYKPAELEILTLAPLPIAQRVTGRTTAGVAIKHRRVTNKLGNGAHARDGRRKYADQITSLATAHRNGRPWETWELDYLRHAHEHHHTALQQAQHLQRTYRAVEDKRKRLWKQLDRQIGVQQCLPSTTTATPSGCGERKETV